MSIGRYFDLQNDDLNILHIYKSYRVVCHEIYTLKIEIFMYNYILCQ